MFSFLLLKQSQTKLISQSELRISCNLLQVFEVKEGINEPSFLSDDCTEKLILPKHLVMGKEKNRSIRGQEFQQRLKSAFFFFW